MANYRNISDLVLDFPMYFTTIVNSAYPSINVYTLVQSLSTSELLDASISLLIEQDNALIIPASVTLTADRDIIQNGLIAVSGTFSVSSSTHEIATTGPAITVYASGTVSIDAGSTLIITSQPRIHNDGLFIVDGKITYDDAITLEGISIYDSAENVVVAPTIAPEVAHMPPKNSCLIKKSLVVEEELWVVGNKDATTPPYALQINARGAGGIETGAVGVTIDAPLLVTGTFSAKRDHITAGHTTLKDLTVTGATILKGATSLNRGLTVAGGPTTLNDGLTVNGTFSAKGDNITAGHTSLNHLTVAGPTTLNHGLTVAGGPTSLKDELTVSKKTTLNDGLTVNGTFSAKGEQYNSWSYLVKPLNGCWSYLP